MNITLTSVIIDAADLEPESAFWHRLLGGVIEGLTSTTRRSRLPFRGIAAEAVALSTSDTFTRIHLDGLVVSSAAYEGTCAGEKAKLPIAGVVASLAAGFLGIIDETIPAGLLPAVAKDLGLSEPVVGRTVTVYALATALTAIPLNAAKKSVELMCARGRCHEEASR